jgi:hypothetical protein
MLFALFDAKEGFDRRSNKGDNTLEGYESVKEVRERVWNHTVEAITVTV